MLNMLFAGLRRPTTVIATVLLLPLLPIEVATQGGDSISKRTWFQTSQISPRCGTRVWSTLGGCHTVQTDRGRFQTMAQASPRSTQV